MKNNFIENINEEKYFCSLIEDIDNSKVGFYSVGLYPASLAYNCAMHGKSNNILLAPREDRDLLGAFSNDVISCLLYTSPSPRDKTVSRMPSSA